MRTNSITVTLYGNRGEHFITFPTRWVICPHCEGHATDRGASVECDGGGFTASEWAEQDEDFRADYLAGRYDRPCRHCSGLGRVQAVDHESIENPWLKKLHRAYRRQLRDDREFARESAWERRMGC